MHYIFQIHAMFFFTLGRKREMGTDSVDKTIFPNVAKHYDCDGAGSLCAVAQSKSSYMRVLHFKV
jgi:hypothetical protein